MDVHKFAISSHTILKLGLQPLRSYFKIVYEYEFHILQNRTVGAEKDHGENYIKVRPPLVRDL